MNEPIESTILNTITRHKLICENDTVIVGVSGGPDSVCLLHVLAGLRDKLGTTLVAAHLNHMIRGSEAERDMEYVRDLCAKLKVRFVTGSADVPKIAETEKISMETAGRIARYSFFRELAEEQGARSIAVAHNRNDRAETILMNIIRGSGPEGLTGIAYRNGDVIRPLLDTDRKDIEGYCRTHELSPRIDQTNSDNIYTRNKIRNEIIPAINSIPGTNVTRAVLRLADLIGEDVICLNGLAEDAAQDLIFTDKERNVTVDAAGFKRLNKAIAGRVARIAVRMLKGDLKDIEALHVGRVMNLIQKGRNGSYIELPNGITVHKSYDSVILQIKSDTAELEDEAFPLSFKPGLEHSMPGVTIRSAVLDANDVSAAEISGRAASSLTQYFDMDKVGEDAVLRHRMPGDRFRTLGSPGTKKLNEVFIDRKVPTAARGKLLLLAEGNEIIWIIGYNINDKYKVDDKTARVLKLEVEKK